ncbi:MAG: DUF4230 domain-containing protein [Oscillospiraceae bacterium]
MEDLKEREKVLPKNKSAKSKIVQALILLLLIALIGCGCFIFGIIFSSNNQSKEEETIPTINSTQITTDIQAIGELATIKYIYTDMGKFENSGKFKGYDIPLTTKSFILSWNGTIKAGVDTTEITLDINENLKKITVNLPKAKILSHETDETSIEIFDEKNNIFNPITLEDYSSFFEESKKDMEQRAIDNGILEDASKNAQSMITQSLSLIPNIELYVINFQTVEDINTKNIDDQNV